MEQLVRIGYWRSDHSPDWPDVTAFVDPGWDEEERHATWMYFSRGTIARTYMGYSPCRLCGRQNGSLEYTDGKYIWPEGVAHYIDDHAVRLPAEVVAHAVARLEEIEQAAVDDRWWRTRRR